jgi:hypothetical protein
MSFRLNHQVLYEETDLLLRYGRCPFGLLHGHGCGRRHVRKLLNWIGTNVPWAMAGKMITLRHGACCSMPAAMPGRIEFPSMKAVRNPGKKAGSPRTSMLGLKTNPSKTGVHRALRCRCGREKILALGLCATCCTLKRQDDEYFGGLREQVLERDGYCCRVCGASGRRKRSIVVHHRVPGKSLLHLMISLCPGCHAKVGRTRVVLSQMPPLLLELCREQHPLGHEQTALDFKASFPAAKSAPLFRETAPQQLLGTDAPIRRHA